MGDYVARYKAVGLKSDACHTGICSLAVPRICILII